MINFAETARLTTGKNMSVAILISAVIHGIIPTKLSEDSTNKAEFKSMLQACRPRRADMSHTPTKCPWCPGYCERCKGPIVIYLCRSARPMTTYFCKRCRIRSFRYLIPKGMKFQRIEYAR